MTPGWKTSEFWTHLATMAGLAMATAVLTYVMAHTAAFPPVVVPVVGMMGPALMAWLQREYADNRTELKLAEAGSPPPPQAPAK